MKIYDPPSGWKYGFPKPYRPFKDEPLGQTLIRDGYPEREVESIMRPDGTLYGVRFWNNGDEDAEGSTEKG